MATIGIGAGAKTDGQVLVAHDMLGMAKKPARFVKNFLSNSSSENPILEAFSAYDNAVKAGQFPTEEHQYD